MAENHQTTTELIPSRAPYQSSPRPKRPRSFNLKVVGGIAAVILVIGLANFHVAEPSRFPSRTAPMHETCVSERDAGQQLRGSAETHCTQKDAQRNGSGRLCLPRRMQQLQQEQAFPGPESQDAAPMTPAQRQAMYGTNNPNAPQKTSGQSQAQAEAKQRQLERERQHQEALNSDTVAIDFARTAPASGNGNNSTAVEAASADAPAGKSTGEDIAQGRPAARPVSAETPSRKDPMGQYDFDGYQGRLYRVFEGTVLEGVLTNHIDGGFNGPMIVMLTTDYYSHDHQQLLLPQGTRLIGQVQSVSGAGQRKLFVTFNRAICPDGFSLDLNKYTGLDPLGTTGLATNVNNHYLSSFAAAAAVGGIGGLAQVGNNGSVLDANTQIRNGISSQTAQESEQILNKFLNRLPVITVKEGSRARVYINQDILIPSYAEHRVDPSL